jgi:glycosyltransferase involved in cell wall biosynthesis
VSQPSVGAVVATHRRPQELRRAIRSILDQEYSGRVECVVVYDRSDAEDLADVAPPEGGDRSLVVIRNERTPGLAGARNAGVGRSTCDLIGFCDDDDEWLQGKLDAQTRLLASTGADVVVAGVEIVFHDRTTVRIPNGDRLTLGDLARDRAAAAHPSTVLARREAFSTRIGPVDENIPGSYGEDYEWLLRAAKVAPIPVVRRPLARVHWGGSLFADRWETIAEAIDYLMTAHPEVAVDRRNRARLQGRIAFAHAALGHRGEAWAWARRSIGSRPLEPRSYLALAVSTGLVKAATIQARANRGGRGV